MKRTVAFIPIVLGTDNNAYGVARAIHESYGVQSICVGKKPLSYTSGSKILTRVIDPRIGDDTVLLSTLRELAHRFPGVPKIIIPCGDSYSDQLSRNSEELRGDFLFTVVPPTLHDQLENKLDFYKTCDQYGLPYPETAVIDANYVNGLPEIGDYPVVLKANDSIEYVDLVFPGKKKAYILHSLDEVLETLNRIYGAGYSGKMILQEYVPGDSADMAVLNAYVNQRGKVQMMCFGQCVLDAILPAEIGNYHALYTADGGNLYPLFRDYLERIGYRGYANFDLKFDSRDGKYKVFEINLRQGRSSFHMQLGGCEYVTYLIDDLLGISSASEPYYHREVGQLWLYVDPWVVRKYAPEKIRPEALRIMRSGYGFTEWYRADRSFKRWVQYRRNRLSSIKTYLRYAKRG